MAVRVVLEFPKQPLHEICVGQGVIFVRRIVFAAGFGRRRLCG
jgi:hypothetical protein